MKTVVELKEDLHLKFGTGATSVSRSKSIPLSSARVFLWIKKSAAMLPVLVSGIQISPRFPPSCTPHGTLRCSSCWKYVRTDKTSNKSPAVPLNDIKPVNQDLFDFHADTVVPVTGEQNISYDLSRVQIQTKLQIEAKLMLACTCNLSVRSFCSLWNYIWISWRCRWKKSLWNAYVWVKFASVERTIMRYLHTCSEWRILGLNR